MKRLLVVLCFAFASLGSAFPTEPIRVEAGQILSLGKYLEYHIDPTAKATFDTVQKADWKKNTAESPNFGFSKAAVWLRFQLVNKADRALEYYIQVAYPLLDSLDLYQPVKGGYAQVHTGDLVPFSKRPFQHRYFVFPVTLPPNSEGTYYLRAQNEDTLQVPVLLIAGEAFAAYDRAEMIPLIVYYAALVVMLIYNGLIYFSIRDKQYLYYIGFLFFFICYFLGQHGLAQAWLWGNWSYWSNHFVLGSAALFFAALAAFSREILNTRGTAPRIDYLLRMFLYLSIPVFVLAMSTLAYTVTTLILVAMAMFYIVCAVTGLVIAARARHRPAYFFAASFAVLLFGGLVFILTIVGVLPRNALTQNAILVGSVSEVLLLSIGLADRINIMKLNLAEMNRTLEERVQARTLELKHAIEMQHGDYFLISLLTNPLLRNEAKGDAIKVELFLKQKKQFTFKHWQGEIGGDLCFASNVTLRGRIYTFVVNGDAMGKSLQGAGGSLVAGAILGTMVERNRLSGESANQSPAEWLKNLFAEMHRIFRNFEGSMLITLFAALFDNETGRMHFFNAEHPFSVLYRHGKAHFVERNEHLSLKIGAPVESDADFQVKALQLKPGDVVLLGSDGREDLLIDGKVQNESDAFLEMVEAGRGELPLIFEKIKERGEITDDVSLIRIMYTPPV